MLKGTTDETPLGIFEQLSQGARKNQFDDTLAFMFAMEKELEKQIQLEIARKKDIQHQRMINLSQNKESAMDWEEIAKSVTVFHKLKKLYGKSFEAKGGTEAILQDLTKYIASKLNDIGAITDPRRRAYNEDDPDDIRVCKSALRAILDPAPGSSHGSFLHPGAETIYGAGGHYSAREMVAYRWLAACNEKMPLPADKESTRNMCIEEEKMTVIFYLADIRREHNSDIRPINHPIDEPSCAPGIFGRIGHMHVHNLETGLEEIVSPAIYFPAKMNSFIIDKFKSLPFNEQLDIINAHYYRIAMLEDDEDNPSPTEFLNSFLTDNHLREFIKLLEDEFGPLDVAHHKAAVIDYVRGAIGVAYRINADLLEKFNTVAWESVSEHFKEEVERPLGKNEEVISHIKTMTSVLKDLNQFRAKIVDVRNQHKLDTFENIEKAQRAWDQVAKEYGVLVNARFQAMMRIQAIAREQYLNALEPHQVKYASTRGKRSSISSEERLAKLLFTPFWYQKFKLKFEDVEGYAKLDAVGYNLSLIEAKEKVLVAELAKFLSDPKIDLSSIQNKITAISADIDQYIQSFLADDLDEKALTEQAALLAKSQAILASLHDEIVDKYEKHLFSKHHVKLTEVERTFVRMSLAQSDTLELAPIKESKSAHALLDSISLRKDQAEFLLQAHTRYRGGIDFLKESSIRLIDRFREDMQRNITALGNPKAHSIAHKQKDALQRALAAVNQYRDQNQAKLATARDYLEHIIHIQKMSNDLEREMDMIGYPKGEKIVRNVQENPITSLLRMVNVTMKGNHVEGLPERQVKGNILYGRFTPGKDVGQSFQKSLKQAKVEAAQEFEQKISKRGKTILTPRSVRKPLLTEDEIKKAQHYIMCHADIPKKLKLEKFLAPGVFVKITRANTDPAIVSFINPFDRAHEKQCEISISLLKEYADKDRQLRQEFSHEADILLHSFTELLAIPAPSGASFQNLFIDQLSSNLKSNPHIFEAAINTQTIEELKKVQETLQRYPKNHEYHSIHSALDKAISQPRPRDHSIAMAKEKLGEALQSLYLSYQKPRKI